ncbi:MAG TPA: hypothetical protein VMG82_24095 [Candidatus Sulfotelmatobacter sp.]|nr:hypothetical protein [Candidatus Sulfotelmatobacter sp.]
MQSGSGKQIDVARLKADAAAAGIEILSAHCAADRIRLNYSPEDIVAFAERRASENAIISSHVLCRFYSRIETCLRRADEPKRRAAASPGIS